MKRKKNKKRDYYSCLLERLPEYIEDEVKSSVYYYTLAGKAPSAFARNIILGFSQDGRRHAEALRAVYKEISGKEYTPQPIEPAIIDNYEDALKMKLLLETREYKKYGDEYLLAPTKYLQNLFFDMRTTKAQHAMKIPILFEKERKCPSHNHIVRPDQWGWID